MKNYASKTKMNRGIFHLCLITFIGLLSFHTLSGQDKKVYDHDYLMPQKGKSQVELYSGIPYVAIGLYSYGFSDRFSAGLIYGYTPFAKGYGFRIKSVLAQPSTNFRINLKSPFIYYPHMKSGEGDPWVLAWPAVNAEWKLKNGARIWTGVGLVGAGCLDYLMTSISGKEKKMMPDGPVMEKEGVMAGLWNTFQFGYSKPVSNHLSYVIEVAPVMEGFKLKSKSGFLDAIPVIATVGLSYSF